MKRSTLIFILLLLLTLSGCTVGSNITLSSITVSPSNPTITNRSNTQLTAIGTYSDGSTIDLSSSVTWISEDERIVTVDSNGLATGVSAGTCVITAAIKSLSGSTTLTIEHLLNVYVAGYYNNGINDVATIWKDGVKTDLPSTAGQNARANSVFVSSSNVYVAGYYNNGIDEVATVWKDGVKTDLESGGARARATAVFVNNGTVYVTGYYFSEGTPRAAIWQDGVRTNLMPVVESIATSVFVNDGSVYVSGSYVDGLSIATVWKDGVNTDLPIPVGGQDSSTNSIYIKNDNIYVAGLYWLGGAEYAPLIWTDGAETVLPSNPGIFANANSVFVSGDIVYTAGHDNDGVNFLATVWTDGVSTYLPAIAGQDAKAYSIYVSNNSVYVAGYHSDGISNIATIWKDGVMTTLPSTPGQNAEANSIYVIYE